MSYRGRNGDGSTGVVSGMTSRNTVTDVEDGDGFVFNDNGTMMQLAASKVLAYIKSKIGGSKTSPSGVMEYGSFEAAGGSWNGKTLTLGGMIFKWSQAATGGGYLTMEKDPNTTLTQVSGGQTVYKYASGTVTGNNTVNENIWPNSGTLNISPSITISNASYQHIEYNIFTRSATAANTAHWTIKAIATGSSSLFLTGIYHGPKP